MPEVKREPPSPSPRHEAWHASCGHYTSPGLSAGLHAGETAALEVLVNTVSHELLSSMSATHVTAALCAHGKAKPFQKLGGRPVQLDCLAASEMACYANDAKCGELRVPVDFSAAVAILRLGTEGKRDSQICGIPLDY